MSQRLLKLTVRTQTAAAQWAGRRAEAMTARRDAGQGSFEYLGIAIVIAAIIGVLATTDIGDAIKEKILDAIDKIFAGNGK